MTPGVMQIVGNGRTPVEEKEIESIQAALTSGLPSHPWPYLEAGERVRVSFGAMRGLEGILVDFKNSHRVVLSVTLLQRSVAMEVDLNWVSPISARQSVPVSRPEIRSTGLVPVSG